MPDTATDPIRLTADDAERHTIRLPADEPVSNGDLLLDEVHGEGFAGEDDGIDEVGDDGLEAVDAYDLPGRPAVVGEAGVPSLDGLPGIATASFDVAVPAAESVIGVDERRQISPASSYPWRVHASLRITAADGATFVGTGFFISPRVLVTAGHCVFLQAPGTSRHGWARSIDVMPGRDGDDLPYGSVRATRFYSVRGWTEDRDQDWDYGAIVLDEPLGQRTGWLALAAYSDTTLRRLTGNLAGYPADKPAGTQWYMARRVRDVGTRKVFYDIDTFGGQSGSAVYRIVDGQRFAFAVHAYGTGGGRFNSATRITRPAFDNLQTWRDAHP